MNFRRTTDEEIEINVTSMIDVLLLLLIFFMLSATFINQSEISLALPQASADTPPDEIERIVIGVDRDGQFYVDNKSLINDQIETLKRAIQDAARDLLDPAIVISADGKATHQSVVTVLDAARQLGYVRLTFSTEISDEDDER
jgi:biopolymer transport protein ExbD